MPIVRITRQGLAAIALSVILLWACFIGERLTVRDARAQRANLMRELQQLQREHRTIPVSDPTPITPQPVRVTVG
jgi:hypothetical protein